MPVTYESIASNGITLNFKYNGYSALVTLTGNNSQTFTATNGSNSITISLTLSYDRKTFIDGYNPLEEIKAVYKPWFGEYTWYVRGGSNITDLTTGKKWIKWSDFDSSTVFSVTIPFLITSTTIN